MRKDFEIIAKILAVQINGGSREDIDIILKKENPNYDSERFWKAVETNEVILIDEKLV